MPYVVCPGCDENLRISGNTAQLGQRVYCENCEDHLEVVSISPLDVDWIYEYEHEGADEDEDDDDE